MWPNTGFILSSHSSLHWEKVRDTPKVYATDAQTEYFKFQEIKFQTDDMH